MNTTRLLLLLACFANYTGAAFAGTPRHHLGLGVNGDVTVTAPDRSQAVFAPVFTVLFAENNPNLATRWGNFSDASRGNSGDPSYYHVLTWGRSSEAAATAGHVADGYDPQADRLYGAGRFHDLFAAGQRTTLRAHTWREENGRIIWSFPESNGVTLMAEIAVGADGSEPRLELRATVTRSGWYSFGYTGAPACDPGEVEELWQPLIYTGRRFPEASFLEASARLPLPLTLVRQAGTTVGVMADAAEMPYQPMPTFPDSRFGVALRNQAGQAQPMLFAPILGGAGSKFAAGAEFSFAHRLVVTRRDIDDTQEHLARAHFGFADVRHNILGSLNEAFERMIELGMSQHARFNADLRGFGYDTDVPGSVKNVSAIHPLSVALVTDNRAIFDSLARPIVEFFISRERFLFSVDPSITGQSVSARLGGLGAPLSEFATLHGMSGGHSPFFQQAAESLFGRDRVLNLNAELKGGFWANSLALYRTTGERKWLERAQREADEYVRLRVDTLPQDFNDPNSRGLFFWTSYSPQWIELFELYEATGEARYLEAARKGARHYTRHIWFCPRIPDENVTVNEGGFAPGYRSGAKFPRVPIPEESVPAWQVSEVGLTPESSPTSRGHRGILLSCYAPWMLRIATLTNDRFLHDVARSAVIGRYTDFPGYHLNTARTTVYQKPDFARRPKEELNAVSSIHYNHIWPHIALLLDYLVSDAYAKSRGEVDFPSRYVESYAFVQQKVYGDRAGRVYDVAGLHLWMPRGVLSVAHPELNYIVARGRDQIAIVFTNQSKSPVRSRVQLNPDLIALPSGASGAHLAVRRDGRPHANGALGGDGGFEVEVAAEGITAVVIRGVTPKVAFQGQVLSPQAQSLPREGSVCDLGFRGARAMALRFGAGDLTSVYVYLPDFEREVTRCTLHYRQGSAAFTAREDNAFPFDYTVPVNGSAPVEFYLEVRLKDGSIEKSPTGEVLLARPVK